LNRRGIKRQSETETYYRRRQIWNFHNSTPNDSVGAKENNRSVCLD